MTSVLKRVLVEDCGGHGHALELLMDVFPRVHNDIGSEMKYLIKKLGHRNVLPEEQDAAALIKTVVADRYSMRHGYIHGTRLTPTTYAKTGLQRPGMSIRQEIIVVGSVLESKTFWTVDLKIQDVKYFKILARFPCTWRGNDAFTAYYQHTIRPSL
ncbi:hypothetical protein SI65_00880 [Aspergillus cristatus]|uniref:Uncharacterized protein n=1 Tax=Aspergillus cristatus TaxID=573508 RepID=A0A1E3BR85_ASPCR|nr:hypothetical protein SI65_00880 [Aspergillus cristatus]